jgi:polygalacturonase
MKTAFTFLLLFGPYLLHAQVSVKSYGAKGDGYTDDGKAIQAALHSGKSPVYFEAGKTYRTSITLTVPSNVTVIGNKAILKPNSSFPSVNDIPVITTDNNMNTYTDNVSIYVKKGYATFSYGSAYKLKVGAIVLLSGSTYAPGYQYGWYSKIVSISGTTVTLYNKAMQSFTAKSLSQYTISNNVHIKSLFVNLKGRTKGCGIRLKNSTNSTIEYCFVESDPTSTSAE